MIHHGFMVKYTAWWYVCTSHHSQRCQCLADHPTGGYRGGGGAAGGCRVSGRPPYLHASQRGSSSGAEIHPRTPHPRASLCLCMLCEQPASSIVSCRQVHIVSCRQVQCLSSAVPVSSRRPAVSLPAVAKYLLLLSAALLLLSKCSCQQ